MSFYDGWWQTSFTHLKEKWLGCHLCEGETSAVVIYCSGMMFSFVSLFVIHAKLSLLSPFVQSPNSNRNVNTPLMVSLRCLKQLGFRSGEFHGFDLIKPLMIRPNTWKYEWQDTKAAHSSFFSLPQVMKLPLQLNQWKSVLDRFLQVKDIFWNSSVQGKLRFR